MASRAATHGPPGRLVGCGRPLVRLWAVPTGPRPGCGRSGYGAGVPTDWPGSSRQRPGWSGSGAGTPSPPESAGRRTTPTAPGKHRSSWAWSWLHRRPAGPSGGPCGCATELAVLACPAVGNQRSDRALSRHRAASRNRPARRPRICGSGRRRPHTRRRQLASSQHRQEPWVEVSLLGDEPGLGLALATRLSCCSGVMRHFHHGDHEHARARDVLRG
jgi:hypothetical protein